MKPSLRSLLLSAVIAAFVPATVQAQSDFPSRPIKLIVPFAAGGGIDITARITAQRLGEVLGQQIIVQNQGGAGGAIATDSIVKADPDGYSLLYHSTTGIVHAGCSLGIFSISTRHIRQAACRLSPS